MTREATPEVQTRILAALSRVAESDGDIRQAMIYQVRSDEQQAIADEQE